MPERHGCRPLVLQGVNGDDPTSRKVGALHCIHPDATKADHHHRLAGPDTSPLTAEPHPVVTPHPTSVAFVERKVRFDLDAERLAHDGAG